MAVRILYIFGVFALLLTGAVLTICVLDRGGKNPQVERLCQQPSVLEQFEEIHNGRVAPTEKGPPLVVAAQAFSSYLDGPPVQSKREAAVVQQRPPRSITKTPKIRFASSAKFTLKGTSYYESQPDRSIALIAEPGSPERNQRWVKEGERLGRFVIHQIRRGVVVYRDENEQLHEMTIERKAATRSIVRDYISSVAVARPKPGQLSVPGDRPEGNSLAE